MKRESRPPTPDPRPPALIALQRAARNALALARRTKTPAYVLQDGKLIDLASRAHPSRKKPRHA